MHDIYQKKIMDHFHGSPYRGRIEQPDFVTDATSPSCGDHIVFTARCAGTTVTDLRFEGEGSIIGQAAASILCEHVVGVSFENILALRDNDLLALMGIDLGPTRRRTVTFVLETLQKGIRAHAQSQQAF